MTTLKDGKRVKNRLLLIANRMDNLIANEVNNNTWVKYRSERLKSASNKTVNNEQGFIVAVYNKLYELDEINYSSPINKVKKIKITQKRLRYLSDDEITRLLGVLEGNTLIATKLCLSTSARWGEVNRLEPNQLVGNKLTLNSKSTKQRTIPISKELAKSINPPLMASEKLFKQGLKETEIELDKGQNTHILHHSFCD
jgi:integrase